MATTRVPLGQGTEGGTGNSPKAFSWAGFSKAFLLEYQKEGLSQKGQQLSQPQLHTPRCSEGRASHCREEKQKEVQNWAALATFINRSDWDKLRTA